MNPIVGQLGRHENIFYESAHPPEPRGGSEAPGDWRKASEAGPPSVPAIPLLRCAVLCVDAIRGVHHDGARGGSVWGMSSFSARILAAWSSTGRQLRSLAFVGSRRLRSAFGRGALA
jgi:hypothetical protein